MKWLLARVMVVVLLACSVGCSATVPGLPVSSQPDSQSVVKLREPLAFSALVDGGRPSGGREMLDRSGFVIVTDAPFLIVTTVKTVSASSVGKNSDYVIDVQLNAVDGRAFHEWVKANGERDVVATGEDHVEVLGYADLVEQGADQTVRLSDNLSHSDANSVVAVLVG